VGQVPDLANESSGDFFSNVDNACGTSQDGSYLEAPSAIASFISFTETARFILRDRKIPFNDRMSFCRRIGVGGFLLEL
jgi:hypothetical protein